MERRLMIRIDKSRFLDEQGRTLILRGVNLGGSSKVPYRPDGATRFREGFFDHRNVSFIGRPFPLEEADEHFRRLRAWGFTLLRFLVTWEAIEHSGPGIFDDAYLDYVRTVVEQAGRYGLNVFIDPHQDVWSRFSGGDGAPGWTLEAAGLDIAKLHSTGAAFLHPFHDGPLPRMIWPSNGSKLAAATMFTLFFGGNTYAPETRIDGEPIQDYLQRHYIAAICALAARLKGLPNVLGYDTLNEPLEGYIGWADLSQTGGFVRLDASPSPFQSMLLASGYSQAVEVWKANLGGFQLAGSRILNPGRERAWLPGRECVWKQNGVWDIGPDGNPRLLRPDFFSQFDGRPVEFSQDFLLPFAQRYAEAIRSVDPKTAIFLESAIGQPSPRWIAPDIVYAAHWYDGYALFMKDYTDWLATDNRTNKLVFSPWRIRSSFARQLAYIRDQAADRLGGAPVLLGEFGIPMDMQNKRAYRTGNFSAQTKALDRTLRALDDMLLSGTIWNYTADNTNAHGDQWNDEDLSIFSRDQQKDPRDINSGGRALGAAVRPYARAIAGQPLRMEFDLSRRAFLFEFRHDPKVTAPTEIFVPGYQYPRGYRVFLSDGISEQSAEDQTLLYRYGLGRQVHTVEIRPAA
jgi:hypothetical protein